MQKPAGSRERLQGGQRAAFAQPETRLDLEHDGVHDAHAAQAHAHGVEDVVVLHEPYADARVLRQVIDEPRRVRDARGGLDLQELAAGRDDLQRDHLRSDGSVVQPGAVGAGDGGADDGLPVVAAQVLQRAAASPQSRVELANRDAALHPHQGAAGLGWDIRTQLRAVDGQYLVQAARAEQHVVGHGHVAEGVARARHAHSRAPGLRALHELDERSGAAGERALSRGDLHVAPSVLPGARRARWQRGSEPQGCHPTQERAPIQRSNHRPDLDDRDASRNRPQDGVEISREECFAPRR